MAPSLMTQLVPFHSSLAGETGGVDKGAWVDGNCGETALTLSRWGRGFLDHTAGNLQPRRVRAGLLVGGCVLGQGYGARPAVPERMVSMRGRLS